MNAVVQAIEDVGDFVGDAVSGVVDAVGDVANGVMEAASDAVDYVADNPFILFAAVAAPFALEALAFEAAAAGTAVTTAEMAAAFDASMLADAAALGGESVAATGAGALTAADLGGASAESLAAADAAAGLIPEAAGFATEVAPAAGLSEAAAVMAPEVVAPEVVASEIASVSPTISEMAPEASTLADASVLNSGSQLGQLDAALEIPSAQEAVQSGQEVLATQGSEVAVADPNQVFGTPTPVDPLDELVGSPDTSTFTEEQLAGLTEGSLASEEAVAAAPAVGETAPTVVAPPGYDLNGNPIDDSLWGGIKNLGSAYLENPLALLGLGAGIYGGVNLLDQVINGKQDNADTTSGSNTSGTVTNQTSLDPTQGNPIQGKPISNVGLQDLYNYANLNRDAQAQAIPKKEAETHIPMQFRDFLANSQASTLTPNYVTLEDIQKSLRGG